MTHQTSAVQLPTVFGRAARTSEQSKPRSLPSVAPHEFRWVSSAGENEKSILEAVRTQEQPPKRGALHLLRAPSALWRVGPLRPARLRLRSGKNNLGISTDRPGRC